MDTCPPPALLERAFTALLLDDLADPAIVAHVEVCGSCQAHLEVLVSSSVSAGGGGWDCLTPSRDQRTDFRTCLSYGVDSCERDLAEVPLPDVPGYELLERLGRGGMGVVYKARHVKLNRLVALKMILAGEYAGAEQLRRFYLEAESVARLRHPNIVEIYDIGMAHGMPYITLEYLPGGSLKRLFHHGPLSPRQSAELLARLAQAVHTAHVAGIVHRDLKPANVLLAEDGTPKIADFGLAKRCEASVQTQTGQIMGTPAYMAPEQARGESRSVGPTADVYSLGALLYEALTGQPLFRGSTVIETLQKVLRDEPVAPQSLVPGVPADLETVCLKALAKEPRDRYPTAKELADELDRFLHDEPVRARPLSRREKAYRWCLRHPTRAGLLAVSAALVLMAGLALLLGFYHVRLRQEHRRTEEALAGEQDARRRERRIGYVNDISMAERLYQENQLLRVQQMLDECDGEQRGWEWHYLDRISGSDVSTLTGHTQPVQSLALAPERPLLASGSGDGAVVFWRPGAAHRLLKLPGRAGPVWGLAFSPDGRRLAGVSAAGSGAGALVVWDPGAGSEPKPREVIRAALGDRLGQRAALAYQPNKPLLAVATGVRAGRAGGVVLVDARGEEVRSWTGRGDQGCVALAWSPSGRRLAASFLPAGRAGAEGEVVIFDPDRAEPVCRFQANAGQALALAFSPDGRTLASGGEDRLIELRQASDFTLRRVCCGHTGPVTSVAFRSDTQLVSGGTDTTVRVWDCPGGQEAFVCRGHYGPVRCLAIERETGLIYSASDDITIKAWRPEKVQPSQAYRLHKGAATAVAFGPEDDALLSVGLDGAVWRIDPTAAQPPRLLRQERRPLRQVRFLPHSQTVMVAGGDEAQADGAIRLLDARDGRVSAELDTGLSLVCSLSVSRDGRRLAVVGRTRRQDSAVQVWDMTSRPPCHVVIPSELLPGPAVAAQLYFGGDRLVVMLSQPNSFLKASYVLLDVSRSPRLIAGTRLAINNPCFAVFTREEALLFMGGQSQGFHKLQVSRKGLLDLAHYGGHAGTVRSGALSPDETLLATASDDETIRLWDQETNRELLVLRGDASPMVDVAFSRSGGFLAAAQGSGVIRVWDGRPRPGGGSPSVAPR